MKKQLLVSLLYASATLSFMCSACQSHQAAQAHPANIKALLAKFSHSLENEDPDDFHELISETLVLAQSIAQARGKKPRDITATKITYEECTGLAFYLQTMKEDTLPLKSIGNEIRAWIQAVKEKKEFDTIKHVCAIKTLENALHQTSALAKLGGDGEFSKCTIL